MKLDCNSCGASLKVSATTRFVTCAKCRARLAVRRNESAVFTEVLADVPDDPLGAGEAIPPSVPVVVERGGGESVLRLTVGAGLIASDIYWWLTDPSLHSFYIRVALLGAGAWLILSGLWRLVSAGRARAQAARAAQAASSRSSEEIRS